MKNILTILLLAFAFGAAFSQAPTTTKKVDIVSKSGQKLNFSEIKIESEADESYKTLEIRYTKLIPIDRKEIEIEGKKYKCFANKKEAIKFYYLVKKNSPKTVIYYVHSIDQKKPEVFTFRVTNY